MTGVTRRSARLLATALLAVGLLAGLGACQVHSSTRVHDIGEVDFVKECGPTRTAVMAVNTGRARYDVLITTDGVLRARRSAVAPGAVVHWTGTPDATQAQVGFIRTGGGGGDLLVTERLPVCAR